jgi:hypothetical protein
MTFGEIITLVSSRVRSRRRMTLDDLRHKLRGVRFCLDQTNKDIKLKIDCALRALFRERILRGDDVPDDEWERLESMRRELKLFDPASPRGDKIAEAIARASPEELGKWETRLTEFYRSVESR